MLRHDERTCQRVWSMYRRTGSEILRNWLIEHYVPVVEQVARHLHKRVPQQVQLEELISAGHFGLMFAVGAFDEAREVKFATYAGTRVRGAMLDYLRGLDFNSRLTRSRSAMLTEAARQLQDTLGRPPSDDELQAHMKLSNKEFDRVVKSSRTKQTVSLSRDRSSGSNEGGKQLLEIDTLVDNRSPSALSIAQRRDLKESLLKGLCRRDKLILVLYYYEGLTMRQIGQTLGISESRVSQLHDQIIAQVRAKAGRKLEKQLVDLAA